MRSLRRWVAVAGVWAVAATIVAVIALLDTRADDSGQDTADIADQISRFQRQLDERLDRVEQSVDSAPSAEDLQRLEERLRGLEDDVQQAAADAEDAQSSVDELQGRIEDLEAQGGDTGGDEPAP